MLESKKTEIILFILGFTLIGIGVFVWNKGITRTSIEVIEKNKDPIIQISNSRKIFVDIAGAVEKPGVYSLVLGARVDEAIASAGGITAEADSEWIAKNLNRAKVLTDGEKLYIPRIENLAPNSNNQIISNNQAVNSKININNASAAELDKLPGIGPVTANKIIAARPFGRVEELIERKVVTQKVWEQIKDMVSVW